MESAEKKLQADIEAHAQEACRLSDKIQQLRREYDDLRSRQEKVLWQQEQQAELSGQIEEFQEQLTAKRQQENEIKQELLAVDMSRQLIESLSEEIHRDFGTGLTASVETFMDGLTGSRRRFFADTRL